MNECLWILEKHTHGWLLKRGTRPGIPMDTLMQLKSVFPHNAIVDGEISGKLADHGVVFAITTKKESELWRQDLGIHVASPSGNLGQQQCDSELNKTKPATGQQAGGET